MRFDFIAEDGCLLGSCTFPGFAGGEIVNIEATQGQATSAPEAKPKCRSSYFPPDPKAVVDLPLEIRSDHFIILSQCCDLEDPRVLVGQLLSARAAGIDGLDENKAEAFRANELGVDSGEGVTLGHDADGQEMARKTLVLPGFFFLPANPPAIPSDKVVGFALARGTRRADLVHLEKVAELKAEARMKLRQRLAVFFGRVPDEDLVALQRNGVEAPTPQ